MANPIFSVFAIDVADKPTVVFSARHRREAQELIQEEWFLADLGVLRSNDIPLAVKTPKLKARFAKPEEIAAFERDRSNQDRPADNELEFIYLVGLDEGGVKKK